MNMQARRRRLAPLLAAAVSLALLNHPGFPSYSLPKTATGSRLANAESDSVATLRKRAAAGDAEAQERLAIAYRWGQRPVRMDLAKARELFELAAKGGRPSARTMLAEMLREGAGGARDAQRARELFTVSAMEGDARAQASLGYMLYILESPEDRERGIKLLKAAAKQGDAYALSLLAYDEENKARKARTNPDVDRIIDLTIRAAQLGDRDAAAKAGDYLYGTRPRELKRAMAFFEEAARRGHARSSFVLGHYYWTGRDAPRDGKLAVRWLTKAMLDGYRDAELMLAQCHAVGFGVPKDEKHAEELFASSEANVSPRMHNDLSWMLAASPIDELRDGRRAVRLMEKLLEKAANLRPAYVDTLAAAYAEVGRFDDAARTQKQAIALLADDINAGVRRDLQSRLGLYLSRKPYRYSK